jgi:hypothetical protein
MIVKIGGVGEGDIFGGPDKEAEEGKSDSGDDVLRSRLHGLRRALECPPQGEQPARSVGAGFRAGGQALTEKSGDCHHFVYIAVASVQVPVALKRC